MVAVVSSSKVIPSERTPTGIFPLSDFDQLRPFSHASLLFVYKPNFNYQSSLSTFATHILTKTLSRALVHFYPFAGQLRQTQGGRYQLNCNAMGARLLEAVSEAKLDDFGDFAPTQNIKQLFPIIDYNLPIEQIPLLLVQLTRFRCGCLTLGVSVSPAVVDGSATMLFVNSWAKLARGEGLDLDSSEILFRDSTLLSSRKLCSASRSDHPEFPPPPLWVGSSVNTRDEATCAIVKLSKEQVENLKKEVNDFDSPRRPYTSFEVIGGLLWRCICKAWYEGNGDRPTRLSTLVNCRRRLRPPLPDSYFGSATIPTVTKTSRFDEVMGKPRTYVVGEIRQALEKPTDEYVRSTLDYIAVQKDMRLLRNSLQQSRGNPNVHLVSWMNFSFGDADFGWGKPVYMGPGDINSEGKAFLFSSGDGDGFVVALRLQASHMDAFKRLFYEEVGDRFPASKL